MVVGTLRDSQTLDRSFRTAEKESGGANRRLDIYRQHGDPRYVIGASHAITERRDDLGRNAKNDNVVLVQPFVDSRGVLCCYVSSLSGTRAMKTPYS